MDKRFEDFRDYKASIMNLLTNADEMDVNEEDLNQLVRRLMGVANIIAGKDYNLPDEFYFILGKTFLSNSTETIKSINQISKNIEEILLVIVVDSVKEKTELEDITKKLSKRITVNIVYAKRSKKSEHLIAIDCRLNSMMFDGNNNNAVYPEGQLFIAKLYDLICLYNEMGDFLFEKNVRYSINNDKNGVDSAIYETLDKEPENFWFYNNGITILADKIECYDTTNILIHSSSENSFSVINGAQTITACARYYFKPDIDPERLKKAKEAYVLLRVITVQRKRTGSKEDKRKIESKISVSLNRQKPIDFEDLAFNSNLVFSINGLSVDNVVNFTICRKGDQDNNETESTYLLSEVARYVLASKLQSPGRAKNMYKGSILKMEGDTFKKKEILPEISERSRLKSFVSHYGLVNLSSRLYRSFSHYKEIANDLAEDQRRKYGQLLDNGHYYFVAVVIRVLFIDTIGEAKEKINIDRIKLVDNNLDEEKLEKLIISYKNLVKSSVKTSVEYSEIKKDTLYNKIIQKPAYKAFKNEVIKIVFSPKDIDVINTKNI